DPGLLAHLAERRRLGRLARVHDPLRELPPALRLHLDDGHLDAARAPAEGHAAGRDLVLGGDGCGARIGHRRGGLSHGTWRGAARLPPPRSGVLPSPPAPRALLRTLAGRYTWAPTPNVDREHGPAPLPPASPQPYVPRLPGGGLALAAPPLTTPTPMVSSTLDRLPGPRLLAGCLLLLITTPPALSQGTLDREEVRQVADSLGALRYSIEALAQRVVDAYGVAGEPGAREPDGPYRRAAALHQAAASAHNGLVARISLDLADGAAVTYGRYESPFDSVRSAREALWD